MAFERDAVLREFAEFRERASAEQRRTGPAADASVAQLRAEKEQLLGVLLTTDANLVKERREADRRSSGRLESPRSPRLKRRTRRKHAVRRHCVSSTLAEPATPSIHITFTPRPPLPPSSPSPQGDLQDARGCRRGTSGGDPKARREAGRGYAVPGVGHGRAHPAWAARDASEHGRGVRIAAVLAHFVRGGSGSGRRRLGGSLECVVLRPVSGPRPGFAFRDLAGARDGGGCCWGWCRGREQSERDLERAEAPALARASQVTCAYLMRTSLFRLCLPLHCSVLTESSTLCAADCILCGPFFDAPCHIQDKRGDSHHDGLHCKLTLPSSPPCLPPFLRRLPPPFPRRLKTQRNKRSASLPPRLRRPRRKSSRCLRRPSGLRRRLPRCRRLPRPRSARPRRPRSPPCPRRRRTCRCGSTLSPSSTSRPH